MKHLYFSLVCVAAMALAGCAHSVYPLDVMYSNYNNRMQSPEDQKLKTDVWIYFTEKDIPGEYAIISANTYHPITLLPFNGIRVKKMNKRFLEQAVKQADKEGGNAILVQGGGFFYVLNIKNKSGLQPPVANIVNPILDMKTADIVKGGEIKKMKRADQARTVNTFMDEIASNIDYVQTKEEISAVRKKISILSNYNQKIKNPKKAIDKFVRKQTRKVNQIEKKLAKQKARAKAKK